MNYVYWLAGLSALVFVLERLFPAREQPVLRRWLWSDVLHLVFNGHFLGVFLYVISDRYLMPPIDGWLTARGLDGLLYQGVAEPWPLALQVIIALFAVDFVQWGVHVLLHRVPFLWPLHQVHHSVQDGEMDWIVAFRFHWMEPVVYKTLTFVPLAFFGFAPEAMFVHAVFGTLIGHLNHANLSWGYGPLGYLLNNPRMHLHHHDHDGPVRGQNFGIIFSCWDYIFGTANVPDTPPRKLGFPGVESMPRDFLGQEAWPVGSVLSRGRWGTAVASLSGMVALVALWWMARR